MPAQTSGSLTTTGSIVLTKPESDTMTQVQITGTYTSVSFVVEGSIDGTNYDALVSISMDAGTVVSGTVSPSNSTTRLWRVPSEGIMKVRVRTTAVGSGSADFYLQSSAYLGLPFTATAGSGGAASSFASLTSAAGITTSGPTGAGLGYATGAGGTVAQGTDRTTTVVLSKLSGQITTQATSLAAGAEVSFTVTNTTVAATDVVVLNITPGGTGTPFAYVSTVGSGSFQITLTNLHGTTADTSADVINFAVIKAVAA